MNFFIAFIGILAGSITTFSFVPQVVQVYKTKKTDDISLPMYVLFCFGIFCWATYGVLTWQFPIIIFNSITLVLALYILIIKIRNMKK